MPCEKSLKLFKEEFDNDQIIVTANRRLANFLLQEYDERQIALGKKAWVKPVIFPLTEWIETLWKACHSSLRLLNDFQAQQIWKSIIENSDNALINIANTAKLAQSAWQTLHLWNISLNSIEHDYNEEVSSFLRWANLFKEKCEQYQAITLPEVPKKLINALSQYQSHLPKTLYLYGFEEIAPIYQELFSSFSMICSYKIIKTNSSAKAIQRIELLNEEKEIETMARWAKSTFENFPDHKIACIIPELHRLRSKVEAIFTEIFHPEKTIPGLTQTESLFNISAGQSLMQFDLIQSGHNILQLMIGKFNLKQSQKIFQSPYFLSNAIDQSVGALLDLELRAYPDNKFPLYALFKPLERIVEKIPQTTWLRRWQALLSLQKNLPTKLIASQWANHFTIFLQASGWPGARTLDSLEYQLLKRWQKLLLEFSSLDFLGEISLSKALTLFKQLTTDIIFQPQSKKTSIQILGVLEAIGCYFDDIWIMGLNDNVWPPDAKPNPFIPQSLQNSKNMPHANANRELEYTKLLTNHLLTSGDIIFLSASLQNKDCELRSSQLISGIKKINEETLNLPAHDSTVLKIFNARKKEFIEDNHAPATQDSEYLWGGSNIIRDQSLCPFRAFANFRLNAKPLEIPFFGLSPSNRGILLHKALEKIWGDINDYETLKSLKENNLFLKIENKINEVIDDFSKKNLFFPSEKILTLEKKRLSFLISKWLEIEKKRSPFIVLKRESKYQITINNLPLSIQIDRIDQLQDGSSIIIDYKTSHSSIDDWFGDRPRSPQLPLYCVMGNPDNLNFAGISFAILRAKKMEFKGILEEFKHQSIKLPGILSVNELSKKLSLKSWNETKNNWKNIIIKLADDFSKGIAKVDPLDHKTCEYCHLHSLCRIHEK